jgi:predicted membrane-bound spermidine synthase
VYDFIILDLPGLTSDKVSHLYSVEFFSNIKHILHESGAVVLWAYNDKENQIQRAVLQSTIAEAGFGAMLSYNAYSLIDEGFIQEEFLLVSQNELPFHEEYTFYLNRTRNVTKELIWIEPHETHRVHSVFLPNYNILVDSPV